MCNGGGGGRVYGEHLQELCTVYLTRFRTYKTALPPQTKTWEGRGPQTDKHLPLSPFSGQFKKSRHLGLDSISYFVLGFKDSHFLLEDPYIKFLSIEQ